VTPSKKNTVKKQKTREEKEQELSLLNKKLSSIEDAILTPSEEVEDAVSVSSDTEFERMSISEDDGDTENAPVTSTPLQPIQRKPLEHPHFGGKQPKQQRAPIRCINVLCKEEKQKKDDEIAHLKEEVQQLKEDLRKYKIIFRSKSL